MIPLSRGPLHAVRSRPPRAGGGCRGVSYTHGQMYLIYTSALVLGLLLTLPYYAARFRKYRPTLGERLGFVRPLEGPRPIWIHAVSVGELRAVDALIRSVRSRTGGQPVVVSTTTPTARALALGRDDVDRVIYFPLDLPSAVRRTLGRIRPKLVIVAETEIWPNFLRQCGLASIPVFMVNGRISDRSFGRYRTVRRWLVRVLDGYALLGMQSEGDASRIRDLGAPNGRVAVFGNLKYDAPRLSGALDPALRRTLETWQPLVVAASTAEGEEALVLDAFGRLAGSHPGLKLLIAPRRPERFDEVGRALDAAGLTWCRRSAIGEAPVEGTALLLDSIGELSAIYEFASVVFMGGTLVPHGGHNILEAARFRKPVVFGPYMDNFRPMANEFLEAGAAVEVSGSDELGRELDHLLSNPELARTIALSGHRLLEKNRGATEAALDAILGPKSPVMG